MQHASLCSSSETIASIREQCELYFSYLANNDSLLPSYFYALGVHHYCCLLNVTFITLTSVTKHIRTLDNMLSCYPSTDVSLTFHANTSSLVLGRTVIHVRLHQPCVSWYLCFLTPICMSPFQYTFRMVILQCGCVGYVFKHEW